MKVHRLSAAQALAALGSSPEGLGRAEAARRLRQFGPNRVEKARREPAALRLAREFTRFFSIILWIAAGLAFAAERAAPGQGMARLGWAIVAVIVVSGVFSFWQEHRAERTLAALLDLLPRKAKVLREGVVAEVSAEAIVPGDILILEQGDDIPADSRLIQAFDARVNNATVTGESLPQPRRVDASSEEQLLRSDNVALAGTQIVAGQARAVVFATGAHTEFGRIARLSQFGAEAVSPLRREIAHLSRVIAAASVAMGATFFVVGRAAGVALGQDVLFAIGIIVAMVPEGLLPTLTLALVLAARRMARRKVLIRNLPAVETLGATTVICTDKTGTLTRNRMVASRLLLGTQIETAPDVAAPGPLAERFRPFFLAAALCQDLKQGLRDGRPILLGDPMEVALREMGSRFLPEIPAWPRVDEMPFDTARMRASVVYDTPDGAVLYCKGAPEAIAPLCEQAWTDAGPALLAPGQPERIAAAQQAMTAQGLRVLALAYRRLEPGWSREEAEQALVFLGLAGLEDPPRPEVPAAIRRCRRAGIKVIMVTGDHPGTAVALARRIGLVRAPSPAVFTGAQLAALSDAELRLTLNAPEIVFARLGPDHKRRIVDALKANGEVVAVTGDGVNDAPALKSAHIGIAMGVAGTDVAKAAADMVLLDDNFAGIVAAVEEGRAVFDNIRKFLVYILTHNVAELVPYLGFVLFGIPLALTPIQALSVDMGTDSLTALGLGVERPDPDAMRRPPRPPHERLLDLPVALRAYLFLGPIEAAAAMASFFLVLRDAGWHYGQVLALDDPLYLRATTACLSAIVVLQVVNVFLCRSAMRSAFSLRPRTNPLILWGVALEAALLLAINWAPPANAALATLPVPARVWLLLIPLALAMLLLEEGRKWLARRRTVPRA